jgi:hypothetical protein
MLPSTFANLSTEEKAFIIASIDIKLEKEREEAKKIKSQAKQRR